MDFKLLAIFFILSIVNVFLQTTKTLVMIRTDNKHIVALTQAIVYAFYTIVIVYSNCDLPLLYKCLICGLANIIGSELCYIITNPILEKFKKDKLWRITATIPQNIDSTEITSKLTSKGIKSIVYIGEGVKLIDIYSKTQGESLVIKEILAPLNIKYSVVEIDKKL